VLDDVAPAAPGADVVSEEGGGGGGGGGGGTESDVNILTLNLLLKFF
jgi:hypothetical protein